MSEEIDVKVTEGSGNVFADLGLPNARERQAKARLSILIEDLIDSQGWNQTEAAKRMGVTQSDVSNIVNGRLSGFSLERLFNCLTSLGQIVEIGVVPAESENDSGRVLVTY
jgi:predicted XRE-type DNA-binding protein